MKTHNKNKEIVLEIEELDSINKHLLISPGTPNNPVSLGIVTANKTASLQINTKGKGALIIASEGENPEDVGAIKLAEGASGSNFVGLQAPSKIDKSILFTLPAELGEESDYLSINKHGEFIFEPISKIKEEILNSIELPKIETPNLDPYLTKHGTTSFLQLQSKEDIEFINQDFPLGLDYIQKLQPILYKYKTENKKTHYGITVDSILKASLEAGVQSSATLEYKPTEGIQGIRYDELIPVLVRGLQEVDTKIESTKALNQLSTTLAENIKEQLEQNKKDTEAQLNLYITIKELSERITKLEDKIKQINAPPVVISDTSLEPKVKLTFWQWIWHTIKSNIGIWS